MLAKENMSIGADYIDIAQILERHGVVKDVGVAEVIVENETEGNQYFYIIELEKDVNPHRIAFIKYEEKENKMYPLTVQQFALAMKEALTSENVRIDHNVVRPDYDNNDLSYGKIIIGNELDEDVSNALGSRSLPRNWFLSTVNSIDGLTYTDIFFMNIFNALAEDLELKFPVKQLLDMDVKLEKKDYTPKFYLYYHNVFLKNRCDMEFKYIDKKYNYFGKEPRDFGYIKKVLSREVETNFVEFFVEVFCSIKYILWIRHHYRELLKEKERMENLFRGSLLD